MQNIEVGEMVHEDDERLLLLSSWFCSDHSQILEACTLATFAELKGRSGGLYILYKHYSAPISIELIFGSKPQVFSTSR